MMNKKQQSDIKRYWEDRASQNTASPTATTNDLHLRNLEIKTFIETLNNIGLQANSKILDVGCGDGYSTIETAISVAKSSFFGIDYSQNMIAQAKSRLEKQPKELRERVQFSVGDLTKLDDVLKESIYDVVLSDRCLINLESSASQYDAIEQIANHIKPGGYYLAIENFIEGHNNMNDARRSMGLSEISVRWHNLFFNENEFIQKTQSLFESIEFRDFASSYYFATRVIYSAMCKRHNAEPDYNHTIHQLAPDLPWSGKFSPIRMVILRKGN
jgi:ubiquinone/menaquinone biosynthesis C-methylase UbiE